MGINHPFLRSHGSVLKRPIKRFLLIGGRGLWDYDYPYLIGWTRHLCCEMGSYGLKQPGHHPIQSIWAVKPQLIDDDRGFYYPFYNEISHNQLRIPIPIISIIKCREFPIEVWYCYDTTLIGWLSIFVVGSTIILYTADLVQNQDFELTYQFGRFAKRRC